MRSKEPSFVISFHTTADAIAFETKAKEDGFPGRLIPIPRVITAGCGMAWMIRKNQFTEKFGSPDQPGCGEKQPEEFIHSLGISYDRVYDILC